MFLITNWQTILIGGLVVAGCVAAYMLYDWLMANVLDTTVNYNTTYSASKHMADSLVTTIVNPNNTPAEVYFNPYNGKTLIVYNIGGISGPVNRYLYKDHGTYAYPNYNLSGYKIFVLYDPLDAQLFHAHVRYGTKASQEVEYMRYDNNLIMKLFPVPVSIDLKYLDSNPIPSLGSDQLAK